MTEARYWMDETSGALADAIKAYLLNEEPLDRWQIGYIRAYLRQWIWADGWIAEGEAIDDLRDRIDSLTSRAAISKWLTDALRVGIDPL